MTAKSASDFRRHVLLRPYGSSMMTPLMALWLAFSFIIIFLMSLVEGTVWATVSQYFVPRGLRWLAVILAPLFFAGIFAVIWVVDASFITSEKPFRLRSPRSHASGGPESVAKGVTFQGGEASPSAELFDAYWLETLRWWFGVIVRLAIVLVSLLITAPFLTQAIRSDEIREIYDAEVAAKRAAKERDLVRLQSQAIEGLTSRREQLDKERQALEKEAETIRQDSAPAILNYERLAAAYRQEFEDERDGADGRRPGIGSRAREALANAERARAQAERLRRKRNRRLDPITQELAGKRRALGEIDRQIATRAAERQEIQASFTTLPLAEFAQRYELEIPADTIGTRVRILELLRRQDRELAQGALDHFKTIEGLSQALLGILFLSLIALKLFEPKAVRFYFNDTLQQQWQHYQDGHYDNVPGFVSEKGKRLLDPVRFADAYSIYNTDPGLFWRRQAQLDRLKQELEEQREKGQADIEHYKQSLKRDWEREDRSAKQRVLQDRIERYEDRLKDARERDAEHQAHAVNIEEQTQGAEDESVRLARQLAEDNQRVNELERMIEYGTAQLDRVLADNRYNDSRLVQVNDQLERHRKELPEVQARIEEAKDEQAKVIKTLETLRTEQTSLDKRIGDTTKDIESFKMRIDSTENEIDKYL